MLTNPTPTQPGETLRDEAVRLCLAMGLPDNHKCIRLAENYLNSRAAVAGPRVDRALYSELIHIAAELARGNGFLSTCAEDMNPRLKRAGILKTAEVQEERLKDWAYRVRQVANKLSAAASADNDAESD